VASRVVTPRAPATERYPFDALDSHPAAALFPLLEVERPEFGELVKDIREHGLLQPIVLQALGTARRRVQGVDHSDRARPGHED